MSELKYYDIRNVNDLEMNGIKEYDGASSDALNETSFSKRFNSI